VEVVAVEDEGGARRSTTEMALQDRGMGGNDTAYRNLKRTSPCFCSTARSLMALRAWTATSSAEGDESARTE